MENIEQLLQKYGKLNLIPVYELSEALKFYFSEINNIEVGFMPKSHLLEHHTKNVVHSLCIVRKETNDLNQKDGIVVTISIAEDAFFFQGRTSYSSYIVWNGNHWFKSGKFLQTLEEAKTFLKDTKVASLTHDRSSRFFIGLHGISAY